MNSLSLQEQHTGEKRTKEKKNLYQKKDFDYLPNTNVFTFRVDTETLCFMDSLVGIHEIHPAVSN